MRTVVIDIEADGLLDTVSRIWCIVAKDIKTGEVFKFHPRRSSACHTCGSIGDPSCPTCFGSGRMYHGDHKEWEDDFKEFFYECEMFIGHNLIGYDNIVIKRILGLTIPTAKTIDTLVLSRLFRPTTPFKQVGSLDPLRSDFVDNRIGGHSLAAWGTRLGFRKQDFDDFEKYTEAMLRYCVNDVELGHRIYESLLVEQQGTNYAIAKGDTAVPFSTTSIRLEHKTAELLTQQELNGFMLDRKAVTDLYTNTEIQINHMKKELQAHFPPSKKFVREWSPKYNKNGELSSTSEKMLASPLWIFEYVRDDPETGVPIYNQYKEVEFNPQSGDQVAERLLNLGWIPSKFTPSGKPATGKDIIDDVIDQLKAKHPEVGFLKGYRVTTFVHNRAAKWLELSAKDGRMHGRIKHIGAPTHRCAHSDDNMASVSRVQVDKDGKVLKGLEGSYGWDCRSCCTVPKGKVLVGADASGIQLRALAHYMNDAAYTKALLEDDIHTVHQHAAGLDTRAEAKTFIYSWLFGAGDEKIGQLIGVKDEKEMDELERYSSLEPPPYGSDSNLLEFTIKKLRKQKRKATRELVMTCIKGYKTKQQFLDRTPALKRLKTKDIPKATKQGFLVGLDGRKLWIPNEHLALTMYLQGFEAVVMKTAICFFHRDLYSKGVPFKQVAFVHDEVQVETEPEYGDIVGKAIIKALRQAGEFYKTNVPIDGEYQIGKTWADTH